MDGSEVLTAAESLLSADQRRFSGALTDVKTDGLLSRSAVALGRAVRAFLLLLRDLRTAHGAELSDSVACLIAGPPNQSLSSSA